MSAQPAEVSRAVAPRFAWYPRAARSLGPECVAFWRAHGGRLFEWQELWLEAVLGLRADGKWASVDDGLNVARQNGKGVAIQALEVYLAFEFGAKRGYGMLTHTAHEFATALEHQLRLEAFIQDAPELHRKVRAQGGYRHANGQESINLRDGTRIIFKARTKAGARGMSGDLLVWDEAMVLPDAVIGAQMPTLRATKGEHGRKVIYAGSAVDQEVHEHGVTFARLRERGFANDPRVSWFEWSWPFETPGEVTDTDLQNRELWPLANPSMAEGLIDPETMQDEVNAMPARTVAVELGGVGDWPRTDGLEEAVIPVALWDALETRSAVLQLDEGWCLAVDVSPERKTAIAAAGYNQHGVPHVEILEHRQGTRWALERVAEIVERGNPELVVVDAVGPAASLVVPLREAGVTVETVNTSEHGQACGRFLDLVTEKGLTHLGSGELRDAILGAKRRTLGDAWAWSRRTSTVDISPLVAATLALGGSAGLAGGDIQIY